MAHDEARAARIRRLYEDGKAVDPRRVTWRNIANHVGVAERSAAAWQRTGGIEPDHCEKLAEFFGVDFDWVWSGREAGATPDLMATLTHGTQLDRIEALLEDLSRQVSALLLERELGDVAQHKKQQGRSSGVKKPGQARGGRAR